MNAPLIDQLKLRTRAGVLPLERIAALTVLQLELRHLKISRGYIHQGCRPEMRREGLPTWPVLCFSQGGVSADTELLLFKSTAVLKARLAKSGSQEAAKVLALMEVPPSQLSDEDRQWLVEGILRHALVKGDTQMSLRSEFKAGAAVLPEPEQALPLEMDSPSELLKRTKKDLEADPSPGEAHLIDLERERMELMALAMKCGISAVRARAVANFMFARAARSAIERHSPPDDNPQPGREQP